MQGEVGKTYTDKTTSVVHHIGDTVEVTEARFKAINGTAFGVFLTAIPEKKPTKKG